MAEKWGTCGDCRQSFRLTSKGRIYRHKRVAARFGKAAWDWCEGSNVAPGSPAARPPTDDPDAATARAESEASDERLLP